MKINIEYFGQLSETAGKKNEVRELDDGDGLKELLAVLKKDYGETFGTIIVNETGGLRPSVLALLNEKMIEKGAEPELQDGCTLKFLTAIAGG